MPHGQGKEMALRCLHHLVPRIFSARKVGEWYTSLWQEHSLSIPRGWLIPPKMLTPVLLLRRFKLGAKVLNIPHDEINWDMPGRGDVRVLVGFKWQDKKNRPKPPEKWGDYGLGSLLEALDTGYWLDYIEGLIDAWDE